MESWVTYYFRPLWGFDVSDGFDEGMFYFLFEEGEGRYYDDKWSRDQIL